MIWNVRGRFPILCDLGPMISRLLGNTEFLVPVGVDRPEEFQVAIALAKVTSAAKGTSRQHRLEKAQHWTDSASIGYAGGVGCSVAKCVREQGRRQILPPAITAFALSRASASGVIRTLRGFVDNVGNDIRLCHE